MSRRMVIVLSPHDAVFDVNAFDLMDCSRDLLKLGNMQK